MMYPVPRCKMGYSFSENAVVISHLEPAIKNLFPVQRRPLRQPPALLTHSAGSERLDSSLITVSRGMWIMTQVTDLRSMRLCKHADYQRVYRESRKQFSPSMSYFFRMRTVNENVPEGPRVGLTAGRVLGKAAERNRIKRRMREAVRLNLGRLSGAADVVLHPRKSVADMEFAKLQNEVARIFSTVSDQMNKRNGRKTEGERQ